MASEIIHPVNWKGKTRHEMLADWMMKDVEEQLEELKTIPNRIQDIPEVPDDKVYRLGEWFQKRVDKSFERNNFKTRTDDERLKKTMDIIMARPDWKEKYERAEKTAELRHRAWRYKRAKEYEEPRNTVTEFSIRKGDCSIMTKENKYDGYKKIIIKRPKGGDKIITIQQSEYEKIITINHPDDNKVNVIR